MDGTIGGVVEAMKSEGKNVTLVKVRLKDTEDNGEPKEEKGVAYPRVREKMELKYAEKHPESTGAALVQDIIRMSIMCDNEHEMLEVLQRIKAHPDLRIARLKNLFIAKELDAPHFRRLMLNVGPVLSNGEVFIGECQIHIREIFEFKQTRGDLMHGPYEYFRSLYNDSEVAKFMRTLDLFDEVVANPLRFAMLIVVVESITDAKGNLAEGAVLPSTTAELYTMSIDVVLKRPLPEATRASLIRRRSSLRSSVSMGEGGDDTSDDTAKHGAVLSASMIRSALVELAVTNNEARSREFSAESFNDEVRETFAAFAERGRPPPFIKTTAAPREGDVSSGMYQFAHKSFQEVLHAESMAAAFRSTGRLPRCLEPDRLEDTLNDEGWWLNTMRLLVDFLPMDHGSGALSNAVFPDKVLDLGNGRLRAWETFALLFRGNGVVEELILSNAPPLVEAMGGVGWSAQMRHMIQPQLKKLDLSGSVGPEGLKDASDVAFVLECGQRNAFELRMKGCGPLDLATVAAENPRWFGRLVVFDVSSVCDIVTGSADVFGGCGALEVLNLKGCKGVSGKYLLTLFVIFSREVVVT